MDLDALALLDVLHLADEVQLGHEFLPADPGWWSLWKEPDGRRAQVWTNPTRPFITRPIQVARDVVSDEYAFLKANARARTKFTIPSPSWHRIFWHPEYSRAAYPTPEDFLRAIAGYLREQVVPRIVALGGDYIQMDAPNYAQWHVDGDNRAAFEAWGHDMAAELVADAEIDDTVFEGRPRGHPRHPHLPGQRPRGPLARQRRLRAHRRARSSRGSPATTACCSSTTPRARATSARCATCGRRRRWCSGS